MRITILKINAKLVLRLIIIVAVMIVLGPKIILLTAGEGFLNLGLRLLGVLLMLSLAFSFWVLTSPTKVINKPVVVDSIIFFQILSSMLLTAEPMFLVAFELPLALSFKKAKKWLLFLFGMLFVIWLIWLPASAPNYLQHFFDEGFRNEVFELLSIGIFLLFAFFVGYLLNSETKTKKALEDAQSEIVESSRLKERQAVSRELHDRLGHNLTVLNLQLEILKRNSNNIDTEKLKEAEQIAKRLIRDVRNVVSNMSNRKLKPLSEGISELTRGIVNPEISIDISENLPELLNNTHLTILFCIQESLTNCIKHAKASKFDIAIKKKNKSVLLSTCDNGIGAYKPVWGNGLSGLRERVEMLGGNIEIITDANIGFITKVVLPNE